MEKILVNLFVPSLDESFDIYIPSFLTVGEITPLIAQMMEELTQHRYTSSGREIICSIEKNTVLQCSYTLSDYSIKHGEHIILF